MKRIFSIISALAAMSLAGSLFAGTFDHLEKDPIPRLSPPKVHVETLDNGIKLFLLEDRSLPMVQIKVITRGGSIHDPEDKVGLAELSGMLFRSGGAGELGPEEFDAAVDRLGASLYSSFNRETGGFGLVALSEDLERATGLLFDMILVPQLNQKRLAVARGNIEERIRRENDDPGMVAARRFRSLIYGEKSPWARRPDRRSLKRIKADDVQKLRERFMRTGNMIIAAAGDFKKEKLLALIEGLTKGAPRGEALLPEVPEVKLEFSPREEAVVRPLTQSFIRMGHLGIRRHNPDKYALLLMSDILGAGSFKSRLMEDIRTVRGMAYSIWSDMSLGTDYGLFVVGVSTKADQAPEVVDLIRGHIERLADEGDVTRGEIDFARCSILSRLIFEFDRAFKVVSRRADFFLHGYPDDYWQIFRDRIASVKEDDVKDVAGRYLHPEELKVVVVGPKIKEKQPGGKRFKGKKR